MQMVKYVAYNRIYYRGKALGRKYKIGEGTTRDALKKKATRYNQAYNRRTRYGDGYTVKLVAIEQRKGSVRGAPRAKPARTARPARRARRSSWAPWSFW
jgi:hypothetical protein